MMGDLPTIAEQGYAGYDSSAWTGILVSRATPRETVAKLHHGLVAVGNNPAYRERMITSGNEPMSSATPEEFAELIERDHQKNLKLVRDAGIRREP